MNGVDSAPKFTRGDRVRVGVRYPIGHCRTPFYFRGAIGMIERHCGAFGNPEELAYGRAESTLVHLYRVRARLADLWDNYGYQNDDSIEVEVYEHWLEPLDETSTAT